MKGESNLISDLFEELLGKNDVEKKIMDLVIKEKKNQEIVESIIKELK